MAKTKKPVKSKVKTNSKLASYDSSLDYQSMWESFCNSTNKNGTQKYKTVWSFIKAKTKTDWQQKFLWWRIGPKADEINAAYKDFSQYDWEAKRERGFWHSDTNIVQLKNEIANKNNALSKIAQVGQLNLDMMSQLKNVIDQLNREYGNQLFLPELDVKENALRLKLFLATHREVAELLQMYQLTFAKTQGIDIQNLSDFLAMFQGGMANAAGNNAAANALGFGSGKQIDAESEDSAAMRQIASMMIKKAAKQGLPLPDPEMENIIVMRNDKRKVN